jgi:hypothetical protein
MFRASFRFVSSRVHITVSGNCLGLVASLLKLLNKISQPRGQRSLNGVVLTKALTDCPLNIARQSGAPNRFVTAFEHGINPHGFTKIS